MGIEISTPSDYQEYGPWIVANVELYDCDFETIIQSYRFKSKKKLTKSEQV